LALLLFFLFLCLAFGFLYRPTLLAFSFFPPLALLLFWS
jgi:hypothetical protein